MEGLQLTELRKLDLDDVQILMKFYITKEGFPETKPWCFPILVHELRGHGFKVCPDAIRKRLKNLVGLGFLKKIDRTNPRLYLPVDDKADIIREQIMAYLKKRGLTAIFKK